VSRRSDTAVIRHCVTVVSKLPGVLDWKAEALRVKTGQAAEDGLLSLQSSTAEAQSCRNQPRKQDKSCELATSLTGTVPASMCQFEQDEW